MRLLAALIIGTAALAGCGGRPEGIVKFRGFTPNTSLQKDGREIRVFCPGCWRTLEAGTARCPDKKCGTKILWKDAYPCGFCRGTGTCSPCENMEQADGKCFNCKGAGYLTYQGKTPACASCGGKDKPQGTGTCHSCKGSRKCDYCGGEGKLSVSDVKQRATKPETGEAEGESAEPAK